MVATQEIFAERIKMILDQKNDLTDLRNFWPLILWLCMNSLELSNLNLL